MQHFTKKTCNNHINNHILYVCLLYRNMRNFPKFPQNMKISCDRRLHRLRIFAGLGWGMVCWGGKLYLLLFLWPDMGICIDTAIRNT